MGCTPESFNENMANLMCKDMQSPKSPNLNSREYSIWAYMEQKAYKKPHPSVDLMATITKTWNKINEV